MRPQLESRETATDSVEPEEEISRKQIKKVLAEQLHNVYVHELASQRAVVTADATEQVGYSHNNYFILLHGFI